VPPDATPAPNNPSPDEEKIPDGAPDHVVRTVTENSRTLKLTSQGFEQE
jgi:hypothetical protein